MKTYSKTYLNLVTVFIVCLILSNIIAGRLFVIGNVVLPAAVILFPVTYIIGDVVAEVYGYGHTRAMIIRGLILCALASVVFLIATNLPSPEGFANEAAYSVVLGFVPRVTLASLAGFFVGSMANAAIMTWVKKLTQGRWLYVRTISSTLVGEGLDTVVFIFISFFGLLPTAELLKMMLFQYLFKVLYEIAFTPLLYGVVKLVKARELKESGL